MDWITATLTLMLTGLLLAQGISCMRRRDDDHSGYLRRFGLFSIWLWGLSLALSILLISGTVVLSSEFGIIMVQGIWARIGMTMVLVGAAIGGGMGLHVCRLQGERHQGLTWLLIGGLCVGGFVVLSWHTLNPTDIWSLRIYAYDYWWPPLLIWLSVCCLDTILTVVRVTHRTCRLWLATAVVNGLALLALSQSLLDQRWSAILWQVSLFILIPISMSIVTWLLFRGFFPPLPRLRWWLSQVLTWLPASSALLFSFFCVLSALLHAFILIEWGEEVTALVTARHWYVDPGWYWQRPSLTISWFTLLWLCWPGVVGSIQGTRLFPAVQSLRPNWQALPNLSRLRIGFLMASVLLSTGLAALPWLMPINRIFLLDGYIIAWLLLAEAIASGPLSDHLERLLDQQQRSAMRERWSRICSGVRSSFTALLNPPSMSPLLAKTFVALIVLLFLNELPNAGKTLIHPFKTLTVPGQTEGSKENPARDEIGPAITDRVVNTLGLLQQELRQEVILALQPDGQIEDGPKKFELMSVNPSADASAALAKGTELDISGVKVPLSVLFTPVQGPLRRWLGVRTINGSILADHRGYSLLASSDAGETWKVPMSIGDLTVPPAPLSHEVAARLATEFAFHIIRSDETLAPALTKSWAAFQPFKQGLNAWKQFETQQDYRALSAAIRHFQQATQQDPEFAFAYYRLGLALQKDGQPSAAIGALRESLRIDPNLVPTYIALASTLYDFERGSYLRDIGSPLDFSHALHTEQVRSQEARALWLRVVNLPTQRVSAPNLGSAYYGLCRQAYRQGRRQTDSREQASQRTGDLDATANLGPAQRASDARSSSAQADDHMTAPAWFYMAYYYCARAETFYTSLASLPSAGLEARKAQAYTLYTLGNILINILGSKWQPEQPMWNCWIASPQESSANADRHHVHASTKGVLEPWTHFYLEKGLDYFNRALDLLPEEHRIRCAAARTAYRLLHDPKPLNRLKLDPAVRLNLANGYRRFGRICSSLERLDRLNDKQLANSSYAIFVKQCRPDPSFSSAHYYQLALDEYDEAIRRQPTNIEALIGYTNTLWERLIYGGMRKELSGWFIFYTVHAVDHTRRAVALTEDRPSSDLYALARAGLGKTFLMQGNDEWAIAELEEVIKLVRDHPAYHDIHWALAQAYLCAASIKKGAGFGESITRPLQRRAIQLKGDIKRREGMREFQSYGSRPDLPDSPQGSLVCNPNGRIESIPDLPIVSIPAQVQQRPPTETAVLSRLRQ